MTDTANSIDTVIAQSWDDLTAPIVALATALIEKDDPSVSDLLAANHWLEAAINRPDFDFESAPNELTELDCKVVHLLCETKPRTTDEANALVKFVQRTAEQIQYPSFSTAIGNASSFLARHERAAA